MSMVWSRIPFFGLANNATKVLLWPLLQRQLLSKDQVCARCLLQEVGEDSPEEAAKNLPEIST